MVEINDLRVCASILPWRSCGTRDPWTGSTTAVKTAAAVACVEAATPVVWGGDWNHALSGRESILDAVDRLGLQIPTASAQHQIDLLSIDHIAIHVLGCARRRAPSRIHKRCAYLGSRLLRNRGELSAVCANSRGLPTGIRHDAPPSERMSVLRTTVGGLDH